MKELYSEGKDCMWLAQQLKNIMGHNVSFNRFGIDNPILTGVYSKGISTAPYYGKDDVRFYIKYLKNKFLRIQIEIGINKNEDVITTMEKLVNSIATIKQNESVIGLPLAIYKTGDCLTCEYAFENEKEIINALENDNMFDDGNVENLIFIKNCCNCDKGSYAFEVDSGEEILYCTDGGCDTQTLENKTCIYHEYEDGEEPKIKCLCKNILYK